MSDNLAYNVSDPRLVACLEELMGVEVGVADPLRSVAEFGRRVAGMGWIVEVRPLLDINHGEPLPAGGIALIRSGNSVVLCRRHGVRMQVILPSGQVAPYRVAMLRCALNGDRMARADRQFSVRADRSLETLGPIRSAQVREWLASPPRCVRSADEVCIAAAKNGDLMPFGAPPPVEVDAPYSELRLVRRIAPQTTVSVIALLHAAFMRERGLIISLWAIAGTCIAAGFFLAMLASLALDMAVAGYVLSQPVLFLAATFMLVSVGLDGVRNVAAQCLSLRLKIRLSHEILLRVLRTRPERFGCFSSGDLLTRFMDLDTLQSLVLSQPVPIIVSGSTLIGGVAYLKSAVGVPLWPFVLVTLAALGLTAWWTPRLCRLRARQLLATSRYREHLIERFNGRQTMRHLDPLGRLMARIDSGLREINDLGHQSVILGASIALIAGVLSVALFATVAGAMAARYGRGELTVGAVAVALSLIPLTFSSLMKLLWVAPTLAASRPAFERLQEVLTVAQPEPVQDRARCKCSKPVALSVKGLCVSRRGRLVLADCEFNIAPGEWLAIQGASGCGKSTLGHVLAGLLVPSSGTIELDSIEVDMGDLGALRSHIGLVPQDPMLFTRTLLRNMVYGARSMQHDTELAEVLRVCDLEEFVSEQALGLDKMVIGDGANLSCGEKTRIALARALMRSPGMLILDETLSRLDAPAAARIAARLRERGTTVLMLTHEPLHAGQCDRHLRLESGRLQGAVQLREVEDVVCGRGAI